MHVGIGSSSFNIVPLRCSDHEIPLCYFPRVDPDGDEPCTHLKNPSLRLHAQAEAVSADRGSQTGAGLPCSGCPAHSPSALPQLPQTTAEPKPGGREPKQLPDFTAGGYSHLSGRVEYILKWF